MFKPLNALGCNGHVFSPESELAFPPHSRKPIPMFKWSMLSTLLLPLGFATAPLVASAQSYEAPVTAEVLAGWRRSDGTHIAAVRLDLDDGWKTYWRAPGDAGIPPSFTWSGSRNVQTLEIDWPTPVVFSQNGMTSVGYKSEVVLPIIVTPKNAGRDVALNGRLDIGVCKDICVPETLRIKGRLSGTATAIDPEIAAALAERPFSAEEAGVKSVACKVSPTDDGMHVSARIQMPRTGGREFAVIETDNPLLWVAEAKTSRDGSVLTVSSDIMHVESAPFLVNRSGVRITVFGRKYAVDISGCPAS